jgi:glycosyltransferase involved in cell wall biosynthesis
MVKNSFSIIIPAYNEKDSIRVTLDSVLSAIGDRKKSFEIIVVDGNSTDGTASIAKKILSGYDIKSQVIENGKRLYPGGARNLGIRKASYENLVFIDCGITIPIDVIDECIEKAGSCDILWFKPGYSFKYDSERAYLRPYHNCKYRKCVRHCMIIKLVFQKIGYFREDLRAAEDWIFYKLVEKAELNVKFSQVEGKYSGFPKNPIRFMKKWILYFEHSVYAGLHRRNIMHTILQLLFIAVVTVVLSVVLNSVLLSLALAVLLYILARAAFSFYRSRISPTGLKDICLTVLTSLLLEIARATGVFSGLLKSRRKGNRNGIG